MERSSPRPYPESMNRLMEQFARLPGIGSRTAERLAFHILKVERDEAMMLATAIRDVKAKVRHCSICFNFADADPCPICADAQRDRSTVLVVEQPRDLIGLEQTGMYRGVYHVLLGHLSPLEGIEPKDLTVDRLLKRVDDPSANAGGERVAEVIFGLSPNLEGDGTALFLAEELKGRKVKLSRLARGLPIGSQIEYANKAVLAEAILGRQGVE